MSHHAALHLSIAAVAIGLAAAGCAGNQAREESSDTYAEATTKTEAPKCPTGYVLQCETRKTGRIRFSSIGGHNLETCTCEEYHGMPTQSPLPGIY